jgi:glycosyltransferase involved in cell wall biosynthesis
MFSSQRTPEETDNPGSKQMHAGRGLAEIPLAVRTSEERSSDAVTLQEIEATKTGVTAGNLAARPTVATKRILFVTRTYEYGGAEKHLIDLLNRMHQPDLQITVLCFGLNPFTERLSPDPNLVVRTLEKTPNSLLGWTSLFRSVEVDTVVFVHGWSWNLHWIAPIGAWLARVPKRYAIQHLVIWGIRKRTLAHRLLQGVFRYLNLKVSAATLHTTICVSDAVKNVLVQRYGFPKKTMRTIHNGVSLSEFVPWPEDGLRIRTEYGISADEFLLVCAARLSDQKGIDILLDTMTRVLQNGLPCKCIIVGDGPLREKLLERSQQLGLTGKVIFTGFREDIRPYLHASSAFVMTSHREGLPLAILEAMACGLPCIVTDVGGNSEAVVHNTTGLLIPAGSADAAAEAISFLVTHPKERAQMSREALARVRAEFDIETCMTKIKQVILN